MKWKFIKLSVLISMFYIPIYSGLGTITLFLKYTKNSIEKNIANQRKLNLIKIDEEEKQVNADGVFGFYGGSRETSKNGELIFKRKNNKKDLKIIVTNGLHPINIGKTTVYGFVIPDGKKAKCYSLSQENTEKKVWKITECTIKTNDKIPTDSIVLWADPDNVFMQLSDQPNISSEEDLVTPTLEVNSSKQDIILNALKAIKINRNFAENQIETKIYSDLNIIQERTA